MICDECCESTNHHRVCESCGRDMCPQCYGADGPQWDDNSPVCVECDDTTDGEDE